MTEHDDRTLVQEWLTREDGDAFAELVARHSSMVFATSRRILNDAAEAEDITQDCFLKIGQLRNLKGDSIAGLLHTLATHLSINRLKAQYRRRACELAYALESQSTADSGWDDLRHHVDEAIAALPPNLREPAVLHYLEGESNVTIAKRLEIDESTVRYRIKKAVERIRNALEAHGVSAPVAAFTLLADTALAGLPSAQLTAGLGKISLAGSRAIAGGMPLAATKTSLWFTMGEALVMSKQLLAAGVVLLVALGIAIPLFVLRDNSEPLELPEYVQDESPESTGVNTPAETGLASKQMVPDEIAVAGQPSDGSPEVIDGPAGSDVLQGLFALMSAKDPASDGPEPIHSYDVPDDNAMHFFLLAWELFSEEDNLRLNELWQEFGFEMWNDPEVRAMIARNQAAFDALRKGLEVGNGKLPPFENGFNEALPYLSYWRNLTRLMTMEAFAYETNGDYTTALESYTTILQFSEASSEGGSLIHGLVGYAMSNTTAQPMRDSLMSGVLTPDELRYSIEVLTELDAQANSSADLLNNESIATITWVDSQPNVAEALREIGRALDANTDWEAIPDEQFENEYALYLADTEALLDYGNLPYYEAYGIDPTSLLIGSQMGQALLPSMERIQAAAAHNRAQLRGSLLTAALELFRAERGLYPPNLTMLVPAYLPEMPNDPFTGKPFVYEPSDASFSLYSTGADMTDNGGVLDDWQPEGGDLVIR